MSDDDQLADVLVRYEDAIAEGVPLTPEQACRDCPDRLPAFRRLLLQVGYLQAIMVGDGAAIDETPAVDPGGRFRPVSFHARGGLGAVYLGEDAELHRPVAFKTMQRLPALDPAARERFLLEAEVTGRLDHPGVVPVYGVGHDRGGRPFYAMRFVRGQTLADATKRLHANGRIADDPECNVEFRSLLARFVAVCQTAAYAHARGVIHRDIKPGNIMLGPYGETLLVDWGLAKALAPPGDAETLDEGVEPIAPAHPAASLAGAAKGSPAFMSPEQARGEAAVGTATDVYGLGSTLFVLLTGRAPYLGSSYEVLEQVRKATQPPSANQVAPHVPTALDAICAKAMASLSQMRYPSTQAFAADVERWLADEPVAVWREPFATRARRWVNRHRLAVSTAAAALVVAGLFLAVLGVVLDAKNRTLADRNTQLEVANRAERQARGEAEQHLRRNLAQLYDILRFYLGPRQAVALRRDPAFLSLFDNLETYFTDIVRDAPNDPDGRQALTLVRFLRVGNEPSSGLPRDLEKRLVALRQDLEHQIDTAVPTPFQIWVLASTRGELARRLIEAGRSTEARAEVEAAHRLLTERAPPDSDACRTALAMTGLVREQLWEQTGRRPEEAPEVLARLDKALQAIAQTGGKSMATSAELVRWMAVLQLNAADRQETARDEVGPLVVRVELYRARGDLLDAAGQSAEALSDYRIGLNVLETAPPEVADNPALLEQAAALRLKAARIAARRKDVREAWDLIRAAYTTQHAGGTAKGLSDEIERGIPDIALTYLATLDPDHPADKRAAVSVVAIADRAIDHMQEMQADRSAAATDWPRLMTAAKWRTALDAQTKRFRP